jgi:serine O-acetyltransferase
MNMTNPDPEAGSVAAVRRRRIPSFAALREHWREDYAAGGRRFFRPGFQAVAIYRFGVWSDGLENRFARYPLRKLHNLLFHAAKSLYGIEIPASAEIGRRLHVAHQSGIVISGRCVIGDDCLIHQNVTVGLSRAGVPPGEAPRIGNRVEIGAGAVVLDPARIGDDSRIGPNTVVRHEVPAFSKVLPPEPEINPRSGRAPLRGRLTPQAATRS